MSTTILSVVLVLALGWVLVVADKVDESGENIRIVNGTDALDGEFPFVASLRRSRNATQQSHTCGCSIISSQWVLTAAHCVMGREPSSINIQYGVTEITSSGPNVVAIEKIIVHQDYNPSNYFVNDIALVRLSSPLRFNDFTNTVKLPQQGQVIDGGSDAVLVGWGLNSSSGTIQTRLQKVELVIFSDEDCRKTHNNTVHNTNICAGVPGGGKGQCNGDSGGPLLVNGVQVGIVSWSVKPCTIPPFPGVLTKVAEYVEWIQKHMNMEDDDDIYDKA